MKYQEFIKNIQEHIITQVTPAQKVIIQPVVKNNGTVYDGLIIIDPILNISPTIYLNPYYHRYLDGVSMEDIYEDILTTYKENLPTEDFDVSLFKDFEKAKEHIIIKLVNYSRNEELLREIPHKKFYDLAIIYVVAVCDFMSEYATILIHNHHLNLWDISLNELHSIAMDNTPQLLPYKFDKLDQLLEHFMDSPLPFATNMHMFILTNHLKIHGATCMVYPGLLKELAERLNDNLLIIPSSIHEVLIIPEKTLQEEYTLEDYKEMINEVNETQLTDDEMLSNHAYFFLKDSERIIY